MPESLSLYVLTIHIHTDTIDLLRKAVSTFDIWKATQDRSLWTSHGWQLISPYSGRIFISSQKEIAQDTIDLLTEAISGFCTIESIDRK